MEYGRSSGVCIAALVLSIVGIFINPCYIVLILATVFGIMGICETPQPSNRGCAIAACIIVPIAFLIQAIIDILTCGVGIFC